MKGLGEVAGKYVQTRGSNRCTAARVDMHVYRVLHALAMLTAHSVMLYFMYTFVCVCVSCHVMCTQRAEAEILSSDSTLSSKLSMQFKLHLSLD